MSGDEREPRRRVAVREALAAKRQVAAVVRKRRSRLRWIAGLSLLTWFPLGALAQLYPPLIYTGVGSWAWTGGAVLAAAAAAAVYATERRARSRLRSAVARVSLDDARSLMREIGPVTDEDRRELLSIAAGALDRHPAELLPAAPPAGGDGELAPAATPHEPAA